MCSEGSAAYTGGRFLPSVLSTTVPAAADLYNPPDFVRLPARASTPEIDIPAACSRLISRYLAVFFTETSGILAADQIRTDREGST
jgi:hypothetical protein